MSRPGSAPAPGACGPGPVRTPERGWRILRAALALPSRDSSMVAVAARCVHGSPGRSMDPDSLRPDLRGLRCGEDFTTSLLRSRSTLCFSIPLRSRPATWRRTFPSGGSAAWRSVGTALRSRACSRSRWFCLPGRVRRARWRPRGFRRTASPGALSIAAPLVPLAPGRVEARLALSQRLAWDVHAVDLARQRHEVGAPLTRFSGRAGARVRWPRTPAARLRRGRRGPDARSVRVPARSRPPGRLRAAAGQSDVFDSERYAVPVGWRRRRARSTPSRSVSARRCNSTCPAHFRLRHGASCTVSVPVA